METEMDEDLGGAGGGSWGSLVGTWWQAHPPWSSAARPGAIAALAQHQLLHQLEKAHLQGWLRGACPLSPLNSKNAISLHEATTALDLAHHELLFQSGSASRSPALVAGARDLPGCWAAASMALALAGPMFLLGFSVVNKWVSSENLFSHVVAVL